MFIGAAWLKPAIAAMRFVLAEAMAIRAVRVAAPDTSYSKKLSPPLRSDRWFNRQRIPSRAHKRHNLVQASGMEANREASMYAGRYETCPEWLRGQYSLTTVVKSLAKRATG